MSLPLTNYKQSNSSELDFLDFYAPPTTKTRKNSSAKRRPRRKKKAVGLEQITKRILAIMQTSGRVSFKEIHNELGLDYRRAYDIINVLLTTPLVSKQSSTRRHSENPFVYSDGIPMPEATDVSTLMTDIETVQKNIYNLNDQIKKLQNEIGENLGVEVNEHAYTPFLEQHQFGTEQNTAAQQKEVQQPEDSKLEDAVTTNATEDEVYNAYM
ncbi:hypothetical protein PCE1_000319 [Barthelona sp. PCE]